MVSLSDNDKEELIEAVSELDAEDREALAEMITESPELLRQTLIEYGYMEVEHEDDDRFVTDEEGEGLSDPQRELARHLEGILEEPLSVDDIVDIVGAEDSEFREKYSSAQYRTWVGDQLNGLVDKGELGRFRDGRSVYYTETPQEAVRHWARINERFVEDLSVSDAFDVSRDTGMPPKTVREIIKNHQ